VIDFRIVTKSGEDRWIDHICQPVQGIDGMPLGRRGCNRDVSERVAEADSLRRVSNALLRKIAPDEVLELVCAEARRLTGAQGSAVFLIEEGECFRMTQGSGWALPGSAGDSLDRCYSGQPVWPGPPSDADGAQAGQPENPSELAAPLQVEGKVIGALHIAGKPQGFSPKDLRMIGLFADQAAIAIDNARLRLLAEQVAVMEERHRLARELHDSVTQTLYSGALYADAALKALAAGKNEVMAEHLREVRALARDAMRDMRLLVFELHPPALEEEGLVGALRTRLAAVESRAGLRTELTSEGDPRISLALQKELYRVAQEALNNVVRHSRAGKVTLRLGFDDRRAWLEVEDDGVGFDLSEARERGGFGLRGLRERAEKAGGSFEIRSSPGKGTRLRVELGRPERERS
jgi:signal transduction histidine kinase